jgi:hypothetical protein
MVAKPLCTPEVATLVILVVLLHSIFSLHGLDG